MTGFVRFHHCTRVLPRERRHSFTRPLAATAALLTALVAAPPARADYPIVSHRYLADPGSIVFGDRVYLYNSNDDDNKVEGGYSMHSIVCVSSTDMKNWTDHGIVFQVPADASWANDSWAPQPIARDGTIYLYFGNSGSAVGVAKSTNPIAGFKDGRGSALVNGSTPGAAGNDIWLFDPGALIDDDGQAYLAFGGNGETNARIIKLGADLTSVVGSAAQLAPTGFYEASFLFKRKGIYYFSYSSDSAHGLRIDYLMSSSPMSGYKYAGVVAGQPPSNNNNNHASQFEYKGKWYHAYHNRIVATEAGTPTTYKRNLAIEELSFNADDTIKEVTYTVDGVAQVGRLDPYVRVEAETTNAQSGIETEPCNDGGMMVTAVDAGDWIRVRGVDFGSVGAESFSARVASTKGGTIELRLSSKTGTLLGTCNVPSTGAAQTFMSTTCDVSGATGVNDLYFVFGGSGSQLFNFDSWQFTPVGGPIGTGGSNQGGAAGTGGAPPSGGAGMGGSPPGGGVPGVGGQAGTATAGGAGSGSGGTSNSGGAPASGGSATPGAGTAAGGNAAPESDSGCGCRVAETSRRGSGGAVVLLSAVATVMARRRRRR